MLCTFLIAPMRAAYPNQLPF